MTDWSCYAFWLKPEYVEVQYLKKHGLRQYITYSYGYGPKDAFNKAAHMADEVTYKMVAYEKW